MKLLARGSITDPSALAPYIDEEMRLVGEFKVDGLIKGIYRQATGPGVCLLLEGA
jgi:hypothetical protein